MSGANLHLLWTAGAFVVMLLVIGFYCILVSRNLIRILIGLEILAKAITLSIIAVGYATKNTALSQALAITVIIIEVFVIAIAAGLVINIYQKHDSLSTENLENLKG
ncbi:MAG TPA: NADH-quinone oxidoreductase subunit K [bacterium]|nr:NADH-quinone oxidoreductase subunit K [bacterium]